MLKFSLKHHLLHNDGLTFTAARTLFQGVQHCYQVSCCPECVTGQKRAHCCKDKYVLQKLSPNYRTCSFGIHARGFYGGNSNEKAKKESLNVAAVLKDTEQFQRESSKDLGVELIDRNVKEIFKRKSKHKSRIDVSKYMDNVVDEITDLERISPEFHVQKRVVPKYYKPRSIIETILEEEAMKKELVIKDEDQSDIAEVSEQEQLMLAERGELDIKNVKKVSMPSVISPDMIVNDSKVLQDLVKLGVDLKSLQQKGMFETVMKLNSKKEMAPYIFFLRDNGVPEEEVGRLISRCPWIFQHPLYNLRVRIDYLRSKKFKIEHLSNMFERDPKFLLIPVQKIDARLGYIQKQFDLTGDQIRAKVGAYSKLIIAPTLLLKQNKLILEKSLGFTPEELKTMFLAYPKIFHADPDAVARCFEYVHNVMDISHELIAKTPRVLNTSKQKMDSRHRFLIKCGRDQYDPTKENYISLMSLITKSDEEWCFEVAKSSVAEYNNFMKTI